MRVAIALLADDDLQSSFAAWRAEVCDAYSFRPDNWDFWPHVSLKLPFNVTDLNAVLSFFDGFAASVPLPVLSLPRLALWTVPAPDGETGVLFFEVAETPELRTLHDRLNAELAERFVDTQAPFDGADYRFHLTLAAGGAPVAAYRQMLEKYRDRWTPTACRFKAIALAYFDDAASDKGWQRGRTYPEQAGRLSQ